MNDFLTISETAKLLNKSTKTLRRWDEEGKLIAVREPMSNYRVYKKTEVEKLFVDFINKENIETASNFVQAEHEYKVLELFAGAGGLAVGLEKAGLKCEALNEIDKYACQTLRKNRPSWKVLEGDIKNFDFSNYKNIDVVTGGFPCQAFSYAGKRLGFEDARGTLFYEFARVVKEVNPPICIGENVRGLLNHDSGKTLQGMISILDEIGYTVVPVKVLKAINYKVPQKRERLIIVGIRKDINITFKYPKIHNKIYTLKDALKKGSLYDCKVPKSKGAIYPTSKKAVLDLVPPKGYWRDLPIEVQKEYMGGSFYLSGGKTGMARRIGWDEPCLTLTCSPAQKQTERCHPDETRPFTVREYARIQTFPDDWEFVGSLAQQYKQIGNAVPVNLACELGYSIVKFLNDYYKSSKPK
ncbi:MAG: DNA (cytosine-5-)-methyltransferase [Chitinophagales bacterium]|nr:DNA (cytosine-5-)-methyltransferase [Chitinophagales bacterium]